MKKGVLRKAVSLVLALSLVIALMPTMFASAAEVGDKVEFTMNLNVAKTGTLDTNYEMGGKDNKYVLVRSLTEYVDGDSSRDWKYYSDTVTTASGSEITPLGSSAGLYFDGSKQNAWAAFKFRGIDAGSYNLTLLNNTANNKGCVYEVYILDDDKYGEATDEEITSALDSESEGVSYVGEQDVFQNSEETIDFGTVNIKKAKSGDVMVVIRAVELSTQSLVDGNSSKSSYFIMLNGLTFTYTGELPAQNKEIFGDTAAFFEKTENNDCNVYLISAIESLNYSKAGFKVEIGEGNAEEIGTETVYEKLTVDGVDYTAKNFGLNSGFLYVVKKTLTEGFTGQTINFKPYAVSVDGETTIEGSTYQATLKSN